MSKIKKIKIVG